MNENLLEREARALVNKLNNNLACRRDHPSYGYTKAEAWATYHQLEGVLYSIGVVGGEASANFVAQASEVGGHLGIGLRDLRDRITASKSRGK